MPTCKECEEVITTPLCTECVAEEMATWLAESQPEIVQTFYDVKEEFYPHTQRTTCLKCKNGMDICSYCFIKHIARWLGDINAQEELMEEYNVYFNSPILDSYGVFEVRREI